MIESPESRIVKEVCSVAWWLLLLRGIIACLLGIYAVSRPQMTLLLLAQLLAVYWLVDGFCVSAAAFMGRTGEASRGLMAVKGILGVIAGLIIFIHPLAGALFTELLVVFLLAFLALFYGGMDLLAVFQVRNSTPHKIAIVMSGMLSFVLALVLFNVMMDQPMVAAQTLVRLAGVAAIVIGLGSIFLSLRVRRGSL